MNKVSIHEARTQLSRLVERAARGEAFIIARAERLGFLKGEIAVPDDFDRMGEREIAALFGITA